MIKGISKLHIKMVIGVLCGEEPKKHWQKGEPAFLKYKKYYLVFYLSYFTDVNYRLLIYDFIMLSSFLVLLVFCVFL